MLEGFKYEGIWWPSEDRNKAISGTLNYVPNQKSSLNLIETFDNPKIIHGFSSDGKKITLYESHKTSEKHSFPGFTISEYSPKIILIGDHFSGPLNFTEISINYSYDTQMIFNR